MVKYCVFVQSVIYKVEESCIFGVPVEKITTLTYFFHSGLATLVKTKSWSILYSATIIASCIHLTTPNFRPDRNPHHCQNCGSIFKLRIALHNHKCGAVKKRKEDGDPADGGKDVPSSPGPTLEHPGKGFQCKKCTQVFKRSDAFIEHNKLHNFDDDDDDEEDDQKPVVCTKCGSLNPLNTHNCTDIRKKKTKDTVTQKPPAKNCLQDSEEETETAPSVETTLSTSGATKDKKKKAGTKSHGGRGSTNVPAGWCKRCGLSLKYKDKLASHIKTVHEKVRGYNLKVCPRARCNYSNPSQGGEQDIYIHINDVHYKEKAKGKPVKTSSQASASGTSSKSTLSTESRHSDTPSELPKDVQSRPGPKSKVGDKSSTSSASNVPANEEVWCKRCRLSLRDKDKLASHIKTVHENAGALIHQGDKGSTSSAPSAPIWIYFTLEKDNATCNSCNGTMKSDPPSLIDHLKLFHKSLHTEFEQIQRMFIYSTDTQKMISQTAPGASSSSTPTKAGVEESTSAVESTASTSKMLPAGLTKAAQSLNISPEDCQEQIKSYLKMYNMEGQKGVTQLRDLQKIDPVNAAFYQQMISQLSSVLPSSVPTPSTSKGISALKSFRKEGKSKGPPQHLTLPDFLVQLAESASDMDIFEAGTYLTSYLRRHNIEEEEVIGRLLDTQERDPGRGEWYQQMVSLLLEETT